MDSDSKERERNQSGKRGHARCIHIDWLEVHVLEDVNLYPCDAEYFRRRGYIVRERDYGTRVYEQMFVILDKDDEPMIEVRRKPKSTTELRGILSPYSAHIRLSNRYCYSENPAALMRDFLAANCYEFRRIFRIDICSDFIRFDSGDDPQKFVLRYLRHKFAKINQANRTARGEDRWDGCIDNYLSWGAKKSMVSTKLYNKSKELREVKDKPYIRWSWFVSGLVTDPINMTLTKPDGSVVTPVVWRLEFSIQSGAAGWAFLEDCTKGKVRKKPIQNNLSVYDSDQKLLIMFASLVHHYFHFKYYEPGVRKDRCKDKVLFFFDLNNDVLVKLDRLPSSQPPANSNERLRKALTKYRDTHFDSTIVKACDVILEALGRANLRTLTEHGWDAEEMKFLQALLRERLRQPEEEFQVTLERVRQLLLQSDNNELF